jgi:hypothetical protein
VDVRVLVAPGEPPHSFQKILFCPLILPRLGKRWFLRHVFGRVNSVRREDLLLRWGEFGFSYNWGEMCRDTDIIGGFEVTRVGRRGMLDYRDCFLGVPVALAGVFACYFVMSTSCFLFL